MKFRVFLCIVVCIVACTVGCAFGGCGNRQWYDQIKYDYARQNNYRTDELSLDVYGEYNGTYVFIIDGPWGYPGVEVGTVEIGGVEFYFSSPPARVFQKRIITVRFIHCRKHMMNNC